MPLRRRSRGHAGDLPSGRFRAIVYAGIDPLTGKPRYLKETADSYAAAELVRTRLLSRVDENRHRRWRASTRRRGRQLCDGRSRKGHDCGPLSWRHLGNPAAMAFVPTANHAEPDAHAPKKPPRHQTHAERS